MGVTALWISPVLKQVSFQDTYHGYGIQDFLEVDAHFGTSDDLKRLGPLRAPRSDVRHEIPPGERLITVERALELGIDHFPELHPNVVAFEERLPNMEGQGAISMAELVRRSLRMNPSRVLVGEVLGDEIVTMLNAMSQGNDGSLSTIHANSSLEVFNRIASYAIQSAERLPVEATHMLIAGAIDFVVFVEKRNEYQRGGRLRRFVSSIREVTGVDGRVLSSEVFAPGPDGRAVPHAPVSCAAELAQHGYDPSGGRW